MNVLDVIVLGVLVAGIVKGWTSGFLRQVASVSGFFVGLLAAFLLYSAVGDWLAPRVGSSVPVGRMLAFVLLWIGVPVALSFLAHLLTRAIQSVNLGGLNRFGGACLCALKYVVFLSCLLNVLAIVRLVPGEMVSGSRLYSPVCAISGKMFEVCMPHVVRVVDGVISPFTDDKTADR